MDDGADICAVPSRGRVARHHGQPSDGAVRKQLAQLDQPLPRASSSCRRFSASARRTRTARPTCRPRGDPAGFVQVLDDKTLIIPDRPGNNRLDTMSNIMENPNVGHALHHPGVRGFAARERPRHDRAAIPTCCERAAVNGKEPKVAIRVTVDEAFLHCAKALKRSRLWEADAIVDRSAMPSLGKMILEQIAPPDKPPTAKEVAEGDEWIEESYKTEMY